MGGEPIACGVKGKAPGAGGNGGTALGKAEKGLPDRMLMYGKEAKNKTDTDSRPALFRTEEYGKNITEARERHRRRFSALPFILTIFRAYIILLSC